MEPVPLCKGEIILKIEQSGQLASMRTPGKAAAAIVADADDLESVRRIMPGCPIGVMLDAQLHEEEDTMSEKWNADWMVSQFRADVDRALEAQADFLYIRMRETVQVLRAAVLAVTDVSGIGIFVELPVDEDGRMPDGSSLMSAMGILQRIGVAGIILSGSVQEVTETIDELSPHAFVALGYAPCQRDLHSGQELPEAEFYLAGSPEQTEEISSRIPPSDDTQDPDADEDYILAPVGGHAHFVDATIDISDPIDLEDHFEETLLELEDVWSGALKLEITSPEDIYLLAENQYLLERPVCLAAENPDLFEKALRVFNGIALYDGTWELAPEILEDFRRHYGLVAL